MSGINVVESCEAEIYNSSDNDNPIFTTSTSSDNEQLDYQVSLLN